MERSHPLLTIIALALMAVAAVACRTEEAAPTPPPSAAVESAGNGPAPAEPTPMPTTATPPLPASATAQPAAATEPPARTAEATPGANLLPNHSFEGGHYLQDNIPELQLPDGWRVNYQEGPTGFGGQAWDVFARPETRVLSTSLLPPEEHNLYIFDGSQTVKIFKGDGAVSARLLTDVELQPGTYVFEANFYADVFEKFADGRKFAPADPYAAEAMVFAGNAGTGWVTNDYLIRNTLTHTFTIDTARRVTVGVGFRGRYAIQNNGWFVDDLSLRRLP